MKFTVFSFFFRTLVSAFPLAALFSLRKDLAKSGRGRKETSLLARRIFRFFCMKSQICFVGILHRNHDFFVR